MLNDCRWAAPRRKLLQAGELVAVFNSAMVKYCTNCWRNEHHIVIGHRTLLYVLLMISTLGIAWFFRPKRCICCGHVSVF